MPQLEPEAPEVDADDEADADAAEGELGELVPPRSLDASSSI